MKQAPRRTVAIIVLTALVCWAGTVALRKAEARRWQPLPKGGEVKIYAITYGTYHLVTKPGPPIRLRLSPAISALSRGSWRDFTSALKPDAAGWESETLTPALKIWLQFRGRKDEPRIDNGVLEFANGQTIRAEIASGGAEKGVYYKSLEFPCVPFREKRLRFSVECDGKQLSFEAPNPGYNPNVPRWEAPPLPQTKTVGEIELTLRELTLEREDDEHNSAWYARPIWTIRRNGEAATDLFTVSVDYLDAGGNVLEDCGLLSEPAWKVRATVIRTNAYPFPDDAVRWIGTIHPESTMTPAPEHSSLVPLDNEAENGSILLAGVFGVGQFDIKERLVAVAGPVSEALGDSDCEFAWDSQARSVRVTLRKPAAIVVKRFDSTLLVIRDESGAPLDWNGATSFSIGASSLTTIYPLPKQPIRLGSADEAPVKFEFMARPPLLPKARDAAARK